MAHRFGWCLDGHHALCRVKIVRIGNADPDFATYECNCSCHTTTEEAA